jgi:hypothetical protein
MEGAGSDYQGDFAALFDGSTVLQEDPNYTDDTHLWGFFSGSPDNYTCGGYSSQAVVPFGTTIDGDETAIDDEIVSPSVSLSGLTTTEPVLLSFDVYRDLPLDNLVFYAYHVRSLVSGVWTPWKTDNYVYYDSGKTKTWTTFTKDLRPLIATNATDIKVAIGAIDECPFWCGLYGTGACHSQSPLIDNVRVTQSNTSTGPNVAVQPVDETTGTTPVTVTFDNVTANGLTSLVTSSTTLRKRRFVHVQGTALATTSRARPRSAAISRCASRTTRTRSRCPGSRFECCTGIRLEAPAWVDITTSLDVFTPRDLREDGPFLAVCVRCGQRDRCGQNAGSTGAAPECTNPFNPTTVITYDVPGERVKQ